MVSKVVCTDSEGALRYFADHLAAGDYFLDPSMVRGEFFGRIAARLQHQGQSLDSQAITAETFAKFVECDLRSLGATEPRQRASEVKYIEFTYTPPKAASVAAALDPRVKGELYEALKDELRWFEGQAAVRDRRGDLAQEEVTRPTGEILAALFQHETSRTNDPNFHVHGLIGNVTWDEERQGYFALHYGRMLELRKTLDARINNNLARRLAELGYTVEAAEKGFGLAQVGREVSDLFSERSRQVELVTDLLGRGFTPPQISVALKGLAEDQKRAALRSPAALLRKMGAPLGVGTMQPHEVHEAAVMITRPPKVRISSESLREDVATRLEENGFSVAVPAPGSTPDAAPAIDLDAAIVQGARSVFEKQSVVRLDELLAEVVRLAPGQVGNEALAERLRKNPGLLIRRKDGQEQVTTLDILGEERRLLAAVADSMEIMEPPVEDYRVPIALQGTPERIDQVLAEAKTNGEDLTPDQARNWLRQLAGIHEYVCTSRDQFLNIRGGAGVGKSYLMETLVEVSMKAGRHVIVCAPYGEQSRVLMRAAVPRIEAAGKPEVAAAFAAANTVDSLLARAQLDPNFRAALKGADIYVDEAGLLDTPKALALVLLATRVDARVILQGDTEQLAAVGRGMPVKLLQDELGLGMHIERASISRRQKKTEDKQLAADLSSGDPARFNAALASMIERGLVAQAAPADAIETIAQEIIAARLSSHEVVAVSSVHRIAERLADRVHRLHVEKFGGRDQMFLNVDVKRDLQPAELKSSQFYRPGDAVEFKRGNQRLRREVVAVNGDMVTIDNGRIREVVPLAEILAVYDRKVIERGPGETVVIQEKIIQGKRIHEKGSRQKISRVDKDGMIHFESGLSLAADDGRVRQGDCLTDYKAQGIKGAAVRGIEDNGSAAIMANKESFHVKGTRHIENLKIFVESLEVFQEAVQQTSQKFSATELERIRPVRRKAAAAPPVKKEALAKAQAWGGDFSINETLARPARSRAAERMIANTLDNLQKKKPIRRRNLPPPGRGH